MEKEFSPFHMFFLKFHDVVVNQIFIKNTYNSGYLIKRREVRDLCLFLNLIESI